MPALMLFRDNAYLKSTKALVTASGIEGIRLDQTIFYPLGGGQPGDTGVLKWNGGDVQLLEARKWKSEGQPDDVIHGVAPNEHLPPVGTEVEIFLDWNRRFAHMRMHTAMHLLSALLREAAVTGGQVGAEKSRLDFNMPTDCADKETLTAELNRLISEKHAVGEQWITDAELEAQPDLVRTMSVKPPMGMGRVRLIKIGNDIDLQPCGGTHVANTSEIGRVEVVKIENKGKQNRRVVVAFAGS